MNTFARKQPPFSPEAPISCAISKEARGQSPILSGQRPASPLHSPQSPRKPVFTASSPGATSSCFSCFAFFLFDIQRVHGEVVVGVHAKLRRDLPVHGGVENKWAEMVWGQQYAFATRQEKSKKSTYRQYLPSIRRPSSSFRSHF